MSFPGVSLVPSLFKGVVGISGTRSLLGTGYPGVGWVSGGKGEYSSPWGGYVGMSSRWVITPPPSAHMEYYEIWSTSGRYVSYVCMLSCHKLYY